MNNLVECPVCSKNINKFVINEHVNECLSTNVDVISSNDTKEHRKERKRKSGSPDNRDAKSNGWGFMTAGGDRCQKRMKFEGKENGVDKDTPDHSVTISDEVKTSELSTNTIPGKLVSRSDENANSKREIDLSVPLAELMRPKMIEDYVGQEKAVGEQSMLRSLLESDTIPSLLLWGPPGCGKTTLARVISHRCKGKAKFVQLSATSSGVNDVKEVIKIAKNDMKMFRKRTILFLDEIHRFNKTQQDTLLPHVEDGTITLIGATTENPSFQVNRALLSRCRVVCLEKLDNEQLLVILKRAAQKLGLRVLQEEESPAGGVCIESSALTFLSCLCDGDARQALNSLQLTVQSQVSASRQPATDTEGDGKQGKLSRGTEGGNSGDSKGDNAEGRSIVITSEHVKKGLEKSHIAYDKTGEEHFNCISALHKSMRGSDDSAALYWLARMLEGGETPLYVARRLVTFASEDVGLADSQALPLAVSTYQACHFLGMPECQINLAHCVTYLARAPKSTESFKAYNKAKECVHSQTGPLPSVPLHLRNAPTKLMKDIGYGKGYKYNPAFKTPVDQHYLPESLIGTNFFK